MIEGKRITVVIPCYKVQDHILKVVREIPEYVDHIIAIDDCCPLNSGKILHDASTDPRLEVIYLKLNQGVGSATITGFERAQALNSDVIIKIDGDGQMSSSIMRFFIDPIVSGKADYTKGNRFFWSHGLRKMPALRKFGNTALSFLNKLSTGYWDIMDPTNGYIAIDSFCLKNVELNKLSRRYFFESDMLYRLGIIRAVVNDIPMYSVYEDEVSNLKISQNAFTFFINHLFRLKKRIIYTYFLRDFNQGSLALTISIPLLFISAIMGIVKWRESILTNQPTVSGTLFIIALLFLTGFQLLMNFLNYDISNIPRQVLSQFKQP